MRNIVLNNKIIEYDLKHNSKKNVNIHIKPDLTLAVSAPRWVLKGELENILYNKSTWILTNLEKQKRLLREKRTNILENGHSIWFKGEKYRLYFRQADKNFVCFVDDMIIVYSSNVDDTEYSKKVFMKWLKSQAEEDFNDALTKYRNKMLKKYKIPEYSLQIRSMKSRWGTCIPSKRKVTLNLHLMFAPKEYLEYIALHELTHFLEIYHNDRFYDIVKEFMPNYKEISRSLNEEYSMIAKYI